MNDNKMLSVTSELIEFGMWSQCLLLCWDIDDIPRWRYANRPLYRPLIHVSVTGSWWNRLKLKIGWQNIKNSRRYMVQHEEHSQGHVGSCKEQGLVTIAAIKTHFYHGLVTDIRNVFSFQHQGLVPLCRCAVCVCGHQWSILLRLMCYS